MTGALLSEVWPDMIQKPKKAKKQKKKPKKDKPVFHKKSDAGKGDVPRRGITLEEWGEKWEKIFRPIKSGSKNYEITN